MFEVLLGIDSQSIRKAGRICTFFSNFSPGCLNTIHKHVGLTRRQTNNQQVLPCSKASSSASEVGLDGLPDGPAADGAGDGLLLEEGPLAVLADAEVAARQDHDALLPVLADHAQLVLALTLNLQTRIGNMSYQFKWASW